jgi:sugar O-acyltransferase (sialic acid O-acetyltransferase NeuD family)
VNCIFGISGFAKEVDWLIDDIFLYKNIDYKPDYFIAEDNNENIGKFIDNIRIISESELFEKSMLHEINCFVAVGNPVVKEKIANITMNKISKPIFPNLIHTSVSFDHRNNKVIFGFGNIICSKTVLTTDISINNFVHINLDCTIGHDTVINSYCTLSPGVHISGNVNIGEKVFIGTGAVVLEKINICSNAIIGAGATVTRDIKEPGIYAGTPAKKIKNPTSKRPVLA